MRRSWAWLIALALVACDESAPPDDPGKPLPTDVAPPGLDARQLFVRASLDVRGIRPTEAELARLEADEGELEAMLDELPYHPGFGERIGTIFAEAMQLRGGVLLGFGGVSPEKIEAFKSAISEEAPNLVHFVAATDRPFTEILTSDVAIFDRSFVGEIPSAEPQFPVVPLPFELVDPQPEGLPPGTAMVRYTNGRPASGVVGSLSMTWKFLSNVANAQRGRANAITRGLLCEDYLDRPIDFPTDIPLTDSTLINNAIKNVDGCQACHSTLDPVGAHLWGFYTIPTPGLHWDDREYETELEGMWLEATGTPPGYFGAPSSNGIGPLAAAMANDPRFVSCSVRRVYEAFLGRKATLDDEGQLEVHREAFVASGLKMRPLVRSILSDPAYRGRKEQSVRGGEPEPAVEKLVPPEILASSLRDLTGYAMTFNGRSAVRVDDALRPVVGASDAGPSPIPAWGHVVVHRRLAEASARALANRPRTPGSASLLDGVDLDAPPTAEGVLHLSHRIRSRAATAAEVDALLALWNEVAGQTSSTPEAWTALLTALLADPDLAIY